MSVQAGGVSIAFPPGAIYLVGLMGSGKSTVGKLLAQRLNRTFLDTDAEIERRTGVKISVIFEIEGEVGFRQRERALVKELASSKTTGVVATGGGIVLDSANREYLQQSGTVIYLEAQPELIFSRIRHDRSRPLLQCADPMARLNALYAERDPLYRGLAQIIVSATSAQASRLAADLESRLGQCAA